MYTCYCYIRKNSRQKANSYDFQAIQLPRKQVGLSRKIILFFHYLFFINQSVSIIKVTQRYKLFSHN